MGTTSTGPYRSDRTNAWPLNPEGENNFRIPMRTPHDMNDDRLLEQQRICAEVIAGITACCSLRSQTTLEQHLPRIIQKTQEIRAFNISVWHRLLSEIVSRWVTLKTEEDKKNRVVGHLFNPLELISIGETTHSLLLGNLLNPNGTHGQGRVFLELFLAIINVPVPKEGEWMISIEEDGRVDICLWRRCPSSVILIENKSNWAVDQLNQLYRYWYNKIGQPFPELDYIEEENKRSFQIIYLAPAGGKQPAKHSLQRPDYLDALGLPKTLVEVGVTLKVLTFREDITAWLDHCYQLVPMTNERLRSYLIFYKELWS